MLLTLFRSRLRSLCPSESRKHGRIWHLLWSLETERPFSFDPPLITKQGHELAAWIKGVLGPRNLTTIYITHGHGDHYFAVTTLLKHFPDTKVLATKAAAEHMAQQIEPQFYASWWEASFPGKLEKPAPGLVKVLSSNTIDLEGHAINIIEAGHSDTHDSTFVHVPDLSMVVAGDICYNELHQ
jgi:glyoxylase-like metal-dependent hydrolase (beta-lactamase superfamily II)